MTEEAFMAAKEYLTGKDTYSFDDLMLLTEVLRAPGGCPWDREQTHKSIRKDLLEECYEVAEAIDEESSEHLEEELGDLLLQITLHTAMEKEKGNFDENGVATGVCRKLIYRHPHVFGDVTVSGSGEVLSNWEKLKAVEKADERKTYTDKLTSVPVTFPALMRAQKVGKRAPFFDFADADEVYRKIDEELAEVKAAGTKEEIAEEIGDLLFTVTSLCRKLGVNAEEALESATDKFIGRFAKVENACAAEGKDMAKLPMSELDAVWNKIKHS